MMTIGKYLSLAKKKLDYLRIKMSKKVRLRRVKVKDLAHNRQIRENTIPTDLSSKQEVCFMMKSAFKVMDICLWYLDNSCLRHTTRDRSLFKVFESKKGGNVTFGDGNKSQIRGKSYQTLFIKRKDGELIVASTLMISSLVQLRMNLLIVSQNLYRLSSR